MLLKKVLSEPLEHNNQIRTANCLNRNCVRGSYSESMLHVRAHKTVFQQYRSKADIPITFSQFSGEQLGIIASVPVTSIQPNDAYGDQMVR
jgi:hypothetical protein